MIQAAALLRHSCRWVLAATAPGTGRMPVLVGTPYGLANARNSKTAKAQNERLIQAGLDRLVGARGLPALLGIDFNSGPQESAVIQRALDSGYWLDAAAVLADTDGTQPAPTCYNKDGQPIRVDFLIVNRPALAALLKIEKLDGKGTQGEPDLSVHRPLKFTFAWASAKQEFPAWRRPR